MKYQFSPKQRELLATFPLSFDFADSLNSKQTEALWEEVERHLQIHGFDKDYEVTEAGQICESILDSLYDQEEGR